MRLKSCVSPSFASLTALILACASGCSTADPAEDDAATSEDLGGSVPVRNPSGAYFASINANGSGCPGGSWDAAISPDGQAFTVTFSGYEATVGPGVASAIRDCTLSINLTTPQGFSFTVSDFSYQGYALLDSPGMTASQTAKYYFSGNPLPAKEQRSDMRGPYDNSYVFTDEIAVADQVWSPCGAQRTLNAQTRIVLQNNPQHSGNGYLNTSSVDGQIVMRFGLSWKTCGGGNPGGNPGGGGFGGNPGGGGGNPGGGGFGGNPGGGGFGGNPGGGSNACFPSGFASLPQDCPSDVGGCQFMPQACRQGWCCPAAGGGFGGGGLGGDGNGGGIIPIGGGSPGRATCVPSGIPMLSQNCSMDTGGCVSLPQVCSLGWCCR